MPESSQFLIRHGPLIVFGLVFLEQMGLPLPAVPWFLAAGALSAAGRFNLLAGIALAVVACLIADAVWFYLGRRRGSHIMSFLCRVSLEPDTCVRKTLDVFTRYGMRGIMAAKFVPGMSTITPPLAGMSRISVRRFLFFDGIGSLIYCGSYMLLGFYFSEQVTQIGVAIRQFGGNVLILLVAVSACYIVFKYWERQNVLHKLRMARITVHELRQMQESGGSPVILDLRSKMELESDPTVISGAIHLDLRDVTKRSDDFPKDREIVAYCSCPNEVTSARIALQLHRKGFTRVRPLLGGIDAWRENNFPMETWKAT
jgi:membrane protein DedA with SNARE-associated domain/rhodanese-related sulfurtransferase